MAKQKKRLPKPATSVAPRPLPLFQNMPQDASESRPSSSSSRSTNGNVAPIRVENKAAIPTQQLKLGDKQRLTPQRLLILAAVEVYAAWPTWSQLHTLTLWTTIFGLIFGGCCSNVYTLEAFLKEEPNGGLTVTFIQFIVTAFIAFMSNNIQSRGRNQHPTRSPVPWVRWVPQVVLFLLVNVMNNLAFGYNISVPVHIILRSGGSVLTMAVGFLWGKRYRKGEVLGVAVLTVGVIMAAMADARSKGKVSSSSNLTSTTDRTFLIGLTIIFVAQVLSAIMGIYTQTLYDQFGPHPQENLLYTHIWAIPFFVPLFPRINPVLERSLNSPPVSFRYPTFNSSNIAKWALLPDWKDGMQALFWSKDELQPKLHIPSSVVLLVLNALTQFTCIQGVNLLSAETSALGVTIVLNIRKLISLFISILLFGNVLPFGVAVGAAVVFLGAAIYAHQGGKPKEETRKKRE